MSANTLGAGLLWLIAAAVVVVVLVYILRWLYRRSTKEVAFVRTGFLGEKVVVNGGAFVIPVLHEITPVKSTCERQAIEGIRHEFTQVSIETGATLCETPVQRRSETTVPINARGGSA